MELWQTPCWSEASYLAIPLDGIVARPLNPDERRREQELLTRLQRLDEQIAALLSAQDQGEAARRKEGDAIRQLREAAQDELFAFEAVVDRKYGAAAGRPYDLDQIQ